MKLLEQFGKKPSSTEQQIFGLREQMKKELKTESDEARRKALIQGMENLNLELGSLRGTKGAGVR